MIAVVPGWVAASLYANGVVDSVGDGEDGDPELFIGEIGHIDGFTIYTMPAAAFDVEASIPKPITHGPQRKGRGGKIRRW